MSPPAAARKNASTVSWCSPELTAIRGAPARTCARARAASWRTAAGPRPTTPATSVNGTPNRSCRTKAVRSAGVSVSSTTIRA